MAWLGRCLAAVVLVVAIGACKKSDGTSTGPAGGGGGEEGEGTPGGGGGDQADQPGGAGEEKGGGGPGGGGAGGGGPMGPADFCKTYGEKAKKEGGKAADFWERNYGKDCVKRLTAEKKSKGDEKWNEFVGCAEAQASAAEAFDACEL